PMPGARPDRISGAGLPRDVPPPPSGEITLVVAQSPRYFPHVERHLQSLKKVFAQVRLLYWEKDPAEPLYVSPDVACERVVLPFGARGAPFFLRLLGGFYARLDELRPANIEAIDPYALIPARAYALRTRMRGTRVRIAYFSMEYFSRMPSLKDKPWKRFAWRRLELWGAAGASAAATVCDSIAAHLSRDFRMPVITVRSLPWRVPEAVGHDGLERAPAGENRDGIRLGLHARCGVPEKTAIAIYQGMLEPGRGLETAVRAMAAVPALHFAIIGSGPLREPLSALAQTAGCAARVHFLGEVDFRDLAILTRSACAGLVPVQPLSASYLYSLPGKLFEYIQAGVPVIATSLPEILKVVDGYGVGICLPEYTPETLADALRRLLDDVSLRQSFRANLARAGAELCWEAEETAYLSLYRG
ncbi:MAG: glycosyltransferase family 4 protein, partial [Fibrobacteria bacterium]